MLHNFLKIAYRNINKYKSYAFISIFSLAIGMTCFLFILLFILDELSFDRYHKNANRIFRLADSYHGSGGIRQDFATSPAPYGPALKKDFKGIEEVVRIIPRRRLVEHKNQQFYGDHLFFADASIFKIFTFPFLEGDPQTALVKPFSVVISEEIAYKYFGDRDPLNQILKIEKEDYIITGIMENMPRNSHFYADIFASMKTLEQDPDSVYLNQRMALLLKELKDYKTAAEYARKSIELDPDDMESRIIIAEIYESLGDQESAIREYEKILEADPDQQRARITLASIFIREGRYDSALMHLDRLIEQDPRLLMAHYYRGRIHFELGNYVEAEKSYLDALKLEDRMEPALLDLGTLYEQSPDTQEKAVQVYQRLLSFNPENLLARGRLLEVYYRLHQEEMAQDQIEAIKKRSRPGDPVRRILGLTYLRHGEPVEAISELAPVVSFWPGDHEARYYLAAAYEENKEWEKALHHFRLINETSRYFVNTQKYIAYILEKQERYDEAIECLQKAVKIDKKRNDIYLMMANLLEMKGEYGKAIEVIEEGLEQDDKDIDLIFRLGVVMDRADQKEMGLQQMRRVLEIDPNHVEALNYIGYAYAEQGLRLDEAMTLIKRALELAPERGYIIDSLGWVYYQQGLYDEALQSLKKAFSLEPDEPEIVEHLGDAYFKKAQYENSLQMYQKALSLNHSDKERLKQKIEETRKFLK